MPDPIAVGLQAAGITRLRPLIKLGIVLGLTSVILVSLLGQPRIFRAMAYDGLPPSAPKIHPRFQTPYVSTIVSGIATAVLAGLFSIGLFGELVSIGTQLAFAIVSVGTLVLRFTNPALERPFRAPAIWLVAPLGAATSIFLMCGLSLDTWLRLAVWLVVRLVTIMRMAASTAGSRARSNKRFALPSDRARLPAHLVGEGPQGVGRGLTDQAVTHTVIGPAEACDIAAGVRCHRRALVHGHRARQHDQPRAVIVVVHEHRGRTMLSRDHTTAHQAKACAGEIRHLDRLMQPVRSPLHELRTVGGAELDRPHAVRRVDIVGGGGFLGERG